MPGRSRQQRLHSRRRGIASVEVAVALPVLVLIALGTLETAGVIFTKQALQTARRNAREAAMPSATAASVQQKANEFTERRGLSAVTVTISPPNPPDFRPARR
ncbi:MAG: pilus assembly protein [Pirellulaceae bacterium]